MKIFSLGKLNSQVEKLTSDLSAANAELAKLKEAAPANAEAVKDAEELAAANAELDCQLTAAKADNIALKAAMATAAKERDEAIAKIADFDKKVEAKAAARAAEIVAAQGHPPLANNPAPQPELKGRDRFLATVKIS